MNNTHATTRPAGLHRLMRRSVAASACALLSACTVTFNNDGGPPTSPGTQVATTTASTPSSTNASTPATTVAPATTTATTTSTTEPTTTLAPTTLPPTTTVAPTTTAAATSGGTDDKPPRQYAQPAVGLPLVVDDALVTKLQQLGWVLVDRQAEPFRGFPITAFYADSPTPETSPWLTINAEGNIRGVCEALGAGPDDECDKATVGGETSGRWSQYEQKPDTALNVRQNVSEQLGWDVMKSATWGDDFVVSIDEALLPPEMKVKSLWLSGLGRLYATADANGAAAASVQLRVPAGTRESLIISTLGVNMPLDPYRIPWRIDATVEGVKVNGNDALLIDTNTSVELVWNSTTGLTYVSAEGNERAEAFLRSLIDR